MIFSAGGRLINTQFNIDGQPLEAVKSFCYLGFEVASSGRVTRAMEILNDKAKKALHPLMGAIAKFDLLAKLAIKIFILTLLLFYFILWTIGLSYQI